MRSLVCTGGRGTRGGSQGTIANHLPCPALPCARCPPMRRRAVENTCLPVAPGSPDGVLTYGRGLLQVGAQGDWWLWGRHRPMLCCAC